MLNVLAGATLNILPLGSTAGISATFTNTAGIPATPLNGVGQVKLFDPNGTTAVDWTNMTPAGTGYFLYFYQSSETGVAGTWLAQVRAQDADSAYYVDDINITLKALP